MAKISVRLPSSNRHAGVQAGPVSGRAIRVQRQPLPAEALLDDTEAGGPGWFDSTWALVQGLEVSECTVPLPPMAEAALLTVQAHAPARAPA